MTEQRELRIPSTDLGRIIIQCKCGVEISVDMSKQREVLWKEKGFECPVCHKSFDSNLRNALHYFSLWLGYVDQSGESVSFRITPN